MSGVYVLGGWQSDFSRKEGANGLYRLMAEVVPLALVDAQVSTEDIQVAHVANLAGELFCGQAHLGAMLTTIDDNFVGLPTSRHEAACASGSVATLAAMSEIEAGRYDVALVVGVEVERLVGGARAGEFLGCASWVGNEMVGEEFPWPAQFAEVAQIYADRWGLRHEHLARIAETNFANARNNPNAQTRDWEQPATFGTDDATNPIVRGYLRKTDCGRITDGASAVVLASERFMETWARRSVRKSAPVISGWGHHTAPIRLEDKLRHAHAHGAPVVFPHLQSTMKDALKRAECADVFSLDAIEVHDCFSISEYVAIDHIGLTEPGQSWTAIEDDIIAMGGKLPVNPSGGLLGVGHPVGATGVRMLLDAYKQVSGRAGEYQVEGARTVGTFNVGGSFSTAVALVVRA